MGTLAQVPECNGTISDYAFDLVGNRLSKSVDTDGDGSADEVTDYSYNNKDRLLSEELSVDGTPTRTTSYDWDGPEQVGKTVTEGGVTTSQTQMEYDVAGRLSKVTITTYTSGQASSIVTQEFTYDTDGIKVTQTETVDSDADGTVDSTTSTEYLNDKQNHTGYSQVIEERTDDGTQTRTTTYTIGHDVIAQFSAAVGALVLLTDAHGSTRAVANAAAEVQQQYLYDAYGSLLNMQPGNALTSLLYSGEQFNPVAGLQYLRARWYDPSIGRFTRMDPYSGNVQDLLGLHRYTYANGNPVMGVDPTGLLTLSEVMAVQSLSAKLRVAAHGAAVGAATNTMVELVMKLATGKPVFTADAGYDFLEAFASGALVGGGSAYVSMATLYGIASRAVGNVGIRGLTFLLRYTLVPGFLKGTIATFVACSLDSSAGKRWTKWDFAKKWFISVTLAAVFLGIQRTPALQVA